MLRDKRINPQCGGHDFLPYKIRISAEGLVEDATLQPYVNWCNNRKSPPDPPAFIRNHLAEARALFQQARFRPWVRKWSNYARSNFFRHRNRTAGKVWPTPAFPFSCRSVNCLNRDAAQGVRRKIGDI
jgi:hypothetical protein